MEHSRRHKNRKNHKVRKAPRVPILTYRWEDIRRARRRGGYPWTHLYKPPFTDTIDPEQFTMDALRRSKSATTMGTKSGGVEISEISTTFPESGKTTPSFLHADFVTEPCDDISAKNSRAGSLVIEEYVEDEGHPKEVHMESAESSDNISQYLDKEERRPDNSKTEINERTIDETERTEEGEPKKRKLSAESSYSKYSLSKLGVMKKLREAKRKIKVPKLTFPTKKSLRRDSPPKETKKTKKELKKEAKKAVESETQIKTDKPVYIHIPLNPPEGESDEISSIQSEQKQENGVESSKPLDDEPIIPKKPSITRKTPLKINPAFKQLLKDVRQLKEKELTEGNKTKPDEFEKVEETIDSFKENLPEIEISKPEETKSEEESKTKSEVVSENVPEVEISKSVEEKVDKDINKQKTDKDEESLETSEIKKEDEEEPLDLEEQQISDSESVKGDPFDKLFEAGSNKPQEPEPEPTTSRGARSKSAEPSRKRRSSIESSYSRKSLSKLGILKKLKEASEKIKGAFSLSSLKRKDSKKSTKQDAKPHKPKLTAVVKSGKMEPPKKVEPVYVHIPLKPPEGQTDEFSYLEFESTKPSQPEVKKEERTDSLDSTSPISPKNNDIQFIFLTPPSDDEILDEKVPEAPDTPSSEDISFFGSLKKLAEKVVDEVSPETSRKILETVSEENGTEKSSSSDLQSLDIKLPVDVEKEEPQEDLPEVKTEEPPPELGEKMIVDEEDGLNEPTKTEELKSVLKTEGSTLKKKVSFKRKSKTPDLSADQKDSGYELIQVPKDVEEEAQEEKTEPEVKTKALAVDINQSMSVDEEKSYLDQKIVKDTSLEEDYNKWSKSSDHEYEFINPPDEVTIISPDMTVIDTNHEPRVVISATEILDNPPVGEKKRSFFNFGRFHKEKPVEEELDNDNDQQDNVSGSAEEEAATTEGPSKFQVAFKQRTDQIKNKTNELCSKVRNMKKPHINMPKAPEFKKPQFKKPDFKKFKIEKPKFNLPKIPDTTTIHLPNFGLSGSKKTIEKQTIETRQLSTESNAGDVVETKKHSKFDFDFGSTFPRFKKKKAQHEEVSFATVPRHVEKQTTETRQLSTESNAGDVETKKHSKFDFDFGSTFPRFKKKKKPQNEEVSFATVPRTIKHDNDEEPVTIPLHSEDSEDRWESDTENIPSCTGYEDRETSTDIERLSHGRFDKDIAIDDYERENQEINRAEFLNRWQHGNFSKTDEDNREDERLVERLVEDRFKRVGDSYARHNQNQPTYIDEEEEEEFEYNGRPNRDIVTDLDNLEDDENGEIKDGYSSEGSVSLQKKGRLGKLDINSDEFFVVHEIREGFQTPANALAQMNEYDPIGSNRSLPQPVMEKIEKRTPIKKPKRKKTPHVSQERIPGDEESIDGVAPPPSRPKRRSKKLRKRPDPDDIIVPYQQTLEIDSQRLKFPRESLGILGDDERDDRDFDEYYDKSRDLETLRRIEDLVEEPAAPPRKHKSLKSLTASENESILTDSINRPINIEDYIVQPQAPPPRPSRRSRSHTSSLSRVSLPPSQRDNESLFADEAYLAENQQVPSYLLEKPYKSKIDPELQQDAGYIDEDQPLRPCAEEPCSQDIMDYMGYAIVDKNKPCREPPLPPPRTPPRRRKRQAEQKFATVPRNAGPTRPLRNYSTIGHAKDKLGKENLYENDGENKENEVDITQYFEIEDDVNRVLISGEVVQKMRQRPLPAPPRPPRKPRTFRKSLQDITSKENIASLQHMPPEYKTSQLEEEPASPDPESPVTELVSDPVTPDSAIREARLITPSVYSYEETVTHGSLVVEPLNGAKVVSDSELSSRERLIPVSRDYSDEETSEIPESFKQLKSPDEVVKTDRLQVQDLDVDRLRVNQLLANRIVVSDLDAASILTDDLQSKSGIPLRAGGIELPPGLLEEVVRKLEEREEKKTPNEPVARPLRPEEPVAESSPEPPQPPPRSYVPEELADVAAGPLSGEGAPPETVPEAVPARAAAPSDMVEPEVDDQPPPRPPEPAEGLYFPSQPPPSFYALRAKHYVDGLESENIPTAPRRKRRHRSRSRPISRSSSDESEAFQPRARSLGRATEPSIPELTSRLIQACGSRVNIAIKRLIYHLTENLLRNADGQQDLHVFMIILLVLIAGLILLGYGEDRTVVHLHHWEYFNPPKDI